MVNARVVLRVAHQDYLRDTLDKNNTAATWQINNERVDKSCEGFVAEGKEERVARYVQNKQLRSEEKIKKIRETERDKQRHRKRYGQREREGNYIET